MQGTVTYTIHSDDMLNMIYDQLKGERLFLALFEAVMGGKVEWCDEIQAYKWRKPLA